MLLQYLNNTSVQMVVLGFVAVVVIYWMFQKRKYKLPPGPFAWPLIGNTHLFTPDMHKQMFEWTKDYGPVITLYFGRNPAVVVSNIESALEVLVKRSADYAGRPTFVSVDAFTEGGKDIIFGQFDDATWKMQRKISGQALRYYLKGPELEGRIHTAFNLVAERMKTETGPFNPQLHIALIIFHILYAICFGESCDLDDKEFRRILELDDAILEVFNAGDFLEDYVPCLHKVWPTKRYKTFVQNVYETFNIVQTKIDHHKRSFKKENIRDFTDNLLLAKLEEEEALPGSEFLNDVHLRQTIMDMFFAGLDTSRFTLRFAVLYMALYPDIQSKVQEEIDRVVGKERLPDLRDRENLSYTEACLHEVMRMSTVVPGGVPHEARCDSKIGAFDIPKGTTVFINHWALHHDPAQWKDVEKFLPERFMDENGKLGPKPESWLPFSAGRRVCLGEAVARPELHLIFACIFQKFSVRPPVGVEPKIEEAGGFAFVYPKDYDIIVETR